MARTWRGATRARDAEAYLDYLERTGLKSYRETPGNLGAICLRRILGDRAEFLLISLWTSREAIKAFAGEDIGRARFFPEDDAFLVDRDLSVRHYDVVAGDQPRDGSGGPAASMVPWVRGSFGF